MQISTAPSERIPMNLVFPWLFCLCIEDIIRVLQFLYLFWWNYCTTISLIQSLHYLFENMTNNLSIFWIDSWKPPIHCINRMKRINILAYLNQALSSGQYLVSTAALRYEKIAVRMEYNCAMQLQCCQISTLCACKHFPMYVAWYADSVFVACGPTPASPGQAITTHQGKQLGMTKISLPYDCVPMFGAARAQFNPLCPYDRGELRTRSPILVPPRAFPASLTHSSWASDALSLVSLTQWSGRWEVMNKRSELAEENKWQGH